MPIYRIADLNVEVNPKFKYAGNGLKAMPLSRMNREDRHCNIGFG